MAAGGAGGKLMVPLLKPEALGRFIRHQRRNNSAACLLGLDVGGSKVGLALSDRTFAFAQPLGRIDRRPDGSGSGGFPRQVARRLLEVVREHHVRGLVVGYPLELWTGKPGERCKEVFRFMEGVYRHARAEEEEREEGGSSAGVSLPPFALWDERMTTVEAREALAAAGRMRKGRQAAAEDQVAATLILQGFLDAHMPPPPAR